MGFRVVSVRDSLKLVRKDPFVTPFGTEFSGFFVVCHCQVDFFSDVPGAFVSCVR